MSGIALLMTGLSVDFARLYREQVDGVWRVVSRLGVRPADLEDAVQDVFIVAHRRLDSLNTAPGAWLAGIAVKVARDYRRRDGRKPSSPLEPARQVADGAAGPDELAVRRDAMAYAMRLLEGLSADQREVFVLAELEQLSAPEIAAVTSTPLNTVYSRLRLARARFNELVAEQEKEHE